VRIVQSDEEINMAGFLQNTPWSYGPFSTPSTFGPGPSLPATFGAPSPFGQPPIVQLQQLLQILPQQIQQLQQTIQLLPQHVAALVVQTLIQSQALAGAPAGQPFQAAGTGFPFQSIPAAAPFQTGQPGYVM
jgi:hypothetical protein